MYKKIYTSLLLSLFALTFSFGCAFAAKQAPSVDLKNEPYTHCFDKPDVEFAKPLDVVANPAKYLNKNIYMNATFDKFSILGLDYKPALRENANYIGFLIQRDDVADHDVPLSEMKLFLKRDYAEKFIDLETGDKIQIKGKVFSIALGDPWLDIDEITVTKKAKAGEDTKAKK